MLVMIFSLFLIALMVKIHLQSYIKKLIKETDFEAVDSEVILFIVESSFLDYTKRITIPNGIVLFFIPIIMMLYLYNQCYVLFIDTVINKYILSIILLILTNSFCYFANWIIVRWLLKLSNFTPVWTGVNAKGDVDAIYAVNTSHNLLDEINSLEEFLNNEEYNVKASSMENPIKNRKSHLNIVKNKDDEQ